MYSKVQADSRVPQLEKELEEARLKWVDLSREQVDLAAEVKKLSKLEIEVDKLKQNISKLRNIHQVEVERLYTTH